MKEGYLSVLCVYKTPLCFTNPQAQFYTPCVPKWGYGTAWFIKIWYLGEEYGVKDTLLKITLNRNIFQEKSAELLRQRYLYQVMPHPRLNTAGVGFVLCLRKALKITPNRQRFIHSCRHDCSKAVSDTQINPPHSLKTAAVSSSILPAIAWLLQSFWCLY